MTEDRHPPSQTVVRLSAPAAWIGVGGHALFAAVGATLAARADWSVPDDAVRNGVLGSLLAGFAGLRLAGHLFRLVGDERLILGPDRLRQVVAGRTVGDVAFDDVASVELSEDARRILLKVADGRPARIPGGPLRRFWNLRLRTVDWVIDGRWESPPKAIFDRLIEAMDDAGDEPDGGPGDD
jgi:hypothetical protein